MSKNFISLTFSTPPTLQGSPWYQMKFPEIIKRCFEKNGIRWCAYSVMRVFTATVHGDRCPPSLLRDFFFVGLRFGGLVTNHWFRFSSLYSCWALRCCLFFNHEALLLSPLASVLFRVWWFSTPLRFVGLTPKKVAKKVTMRCSHRYFLIWWYVFMLIYDNTYINVLIAYWWMYPCHTIIFPSTSLSLSWLQWLRWHHSHYCKNWHSNDHTAILTNLILPRKQTVPPWKRMVGFDEIFPCKMVPFQGRYVHFRVDNNCH